MRRSPGAGVGNALHRNGSASRDAAAVHTTSTQSAGNADSALAEDICAEIKVHSAHVNTNAMCGSRDEKVVHCTTSISY